MGTHTGAPYTPMPDKLPPIDTTNKQVMIGPETFTLCVDEAGKVCKTEIKPLGKGHPHGPPGFYTEIGGKIPQPSKMDVMEKMKTAAWDGSWVTLATSDATFTHGGQVMPIGAFLGWCSAVGGVKAFPDWKWTNEVLEELPDGRVKVGSRQATGKLVADIPTIGPFPEIKLSEVPTDSLLLTDTGAVLPVEIGYYTINEFGAITKIEYDGTLVDKEGSNTMDFTPPVGPPVLYAMAGKPLPPMPPPPGA